MTSDPPLRLAEWPLLFADDGGVAHASGAFRTVHAASTRDEPVLRPDRPWESRGVYVYGSVYADEANRTLRLWYQCGVGPAVPDYVAFATSRDGIAWRKQSLRLIPHEGSTENNIVHRLHSPSILLDIHETDPARRYKMLGAESGHYHAAYSADGLRWTRAPQSPILTHHDTITLSRHPVSGDYLAFHKRPAMIRGGERRRIIWLARSRNFQTWTEPELVFAPDEEDDGWSCDPTQYTEINNMSVYPHAAGLIGLPAMFRVTKRIPKSEAQVGQSPWDGPIDIQLATSADGRRWRRTWPRINIIPRSAPGAFDAGTILGVSSTPVHIGDETWVYYTAINTMYGQFGGGKAVTIGRAEWRRHGFVSLDALGPGRVVTKPLWLGTPTLLINADAARGELHVALTEIDGRPISGGHTLRMDDTRWPALHDAPTDRPVRVVLKMNNVRLYSLATEKEGDIKI